MVDKWEKGLTETNSTFDALTKMAPTRTKEIKPIRDAVGANVRERLEDFQGQIEAYRTGLFKRPVLKGEHKQKVADKSNWMD